MILCRAENESFLVLVDHPQEDLDPLLFPLLDLDDFVKVRLLKAFATLDLALDHGVVRGVNVIVECRGDLPDPERCEESVVDPLLE